MKVLQVIDGLRSGGAEGFVSNLGAALSALGVEVKFYLTAGVRGERGHALLARLHDAGIEVAGVEDRKARSFRNLADLAKLVRTWRPDVVQANLFSAEALSAATRFVAPFGRTAYVRRLADTDIAAHRSPSLVRQLDRFFATTIACSPAVAEAYATFMRGRNRSRIAAIPNGGRLLEQVPNAAERNAARRALGIPDGAFVVVHIGRMIGFGEERQCEMASAQKAHDVLIKAFARAFPDGPDSFLLCVGDGPLKSELEKLAASLGAGERVRFLGILPEPWPALKAADAFLFPSRHEGLPNVLPEAASCGLPVVASNIAENSFLNPGGAWIMVPVDDVPGFADALRKVRAELPEFSRRAHELAGAFRERFSMEACARKYIACYEEALGRRRRGEARTP